jgi:hypothetical protein
MPDMSIGFDDRVGLGKTVDYAGILNIGAVLQGYGPKSPRRQAAGPT